MSTSSLLRTLEQERAKKAWECIKEVSSKSDPELKKKYGSLARKVPMLILTNGLGQALAFLKAKANKDRKEDAHAEDDVVIVQATYTNKDSKEDAHGLLLGHLSEWVLNQMTPDTSSKTPDLLKWVYGSDSAAYRRATLEALAFLNWLKRFAEAELPTEK